MNNKINAIDEYISSCPSSVQDILKQVRETIQKAAPEAKEAIKYRMPTFVLNGNLIHFAAFKNHIGLYPTPSAIIKFKNELKGYKTSKGAIQFPINEPMPLELIAEITKFRVEEMNK